VLVDHGRALALAVAGLVRLAVSAAPAALASALDAYALAFASLVLLGGRLGDRLGGAWLLIARLVVLGAASAVGAAEAAAPR